MLLNKEIKPDILLIVLLSTSLKNTENYIGPKYVFTQPLLHV